MTREAQTTAARAPASWRATLLDPLVLANFFVRALLLAVALGWSRWDSADTSGYLQYASDVWRGVWGSELQRPPLYTWFVAALSPGVHETPTALQIAPVLIMQHALVWLAGAELLRRTRSRWLAACWLFDPGLLVYSSLIMSDALFAVCVLAFGLTVQSWLDASSFKERGAAARCGFALGVVLLCRAIAIVPASLTILILGWRARADGRRLRSLALALVVAACVIAPRLYWDVSRYNRWTLASQGGSWTKSVAGVVEYDGQGLDFIHAELKWVHEHSGPGAQNAAFETLRAHPVTWIKLSLKGLARVLVGHLNVEWTHFLTGVTPLGPAWFKAPEDRPGESLSPWGLVFWVIGLLATACYCVLVYWRVGRAFGQARLWRDPLAVWALGCGVVLACTPQVFGDARFRLAVWPFVLLLWARARILLKNREVP